MPTTNTMKRTFKNTRTGETITAPEDKLHHVAGMGGNILKDDKGDQFAGENIWFDCDRAEFIQLDMTPWNWHTAYRIVGMDGGEDEGLTLEEWAEALKDNNLLRLFYIPNSEEAILLRDDYDLSECHWEETTQ